MNWLARLAVAAVFLNATAVTAADLKVVASPWPPYVGQGLQKDGLAMHVVKEGLRRAGYRASTVLTNWPQDLEGTKRGTYDVIASVWYSQERAKHITFSKPYIVSELRFVKRQGTPHRFDAPADLKGLSIGVVEGYAYGERLYRESDFKQSSRGSVLQNLRGLLAGHLDLVLADTRVALYELNVNIAYGIKETEILPKPYAKKGLRIGVSKQHPLHESIVTDFDSAIAAMKADGTYGAILALHRVSNK